MIKNILQYLEKSAAQNPNKILVKDEKESLTFLQMQTISKSIGTALLNDGIKKAPVVVFMEKTPSELATFMGVIYSGSFYIPVDLEMPEYRIDLIIKTANPKAIIYDENAKEYVSKLDCKKYEYEQIRTTPIDEEKLSEIRKTQLDLDPIYAVFTSGSTGIPKGVLGSHRATIDYIENITKVLGYSEETIVANQSPFYGDAYLKDFGPAIKKSASMIITPKQHFMFPVNLIKFLNDNRVNKIAWTASALSLISAVKAFDKTKPEHIDTIAFVGEVFPIKHLNIWKSAMPNARFINLYGPTEATGVSCYYEVDRDFNLDESLPIGNPFENTQILLLDDNGNKVVKGEVGEICIKGTCLTLGYFNNPEKTKENFIQNPTNSIYPEIIYKTGDLGKYNENDELMYVSRKDYQIKHLGHRIELGEIEVVIGALENVDSVCCIFDDEKQKIALYYTGTIDKKDIASYAKEKLPRYMFPSYIEQLEKMLYTTNGKIDRAGLKARYKNK